MGEMKSAWQIAMEKADKLGKASPEEMHSIKFVPEGNKLASMFLLDDKMNLAAEISKLQTGEAEKYVKKGIEEILLRNISLPHSEEDMRRTKKSMDGLRIIKNDKKQVEAAFGLINNLINQYQLALQQTYSEFKKKAEAALQQAGRNMQPQRGNQMSLEQKIQLQIQEEWRQVHSELDAQYDKALEGHRQKIRELS